MKKKLGNAARIFSGGKGFKMVLSGSPDFRKQIDSIKLILNFVSQKKKKLYAFIFIDFNVLLCFGGKVAYRLAWIAGDTQENKMKIF